MNVHIVQEKERLAFSNNAIIYNDVDLLLTWLQKISIFTTDQGPVFDDVALAFYFNEMILMLPSEHHSYEKIYDAISDSLVLDYENVIKAMSCVENAEFTIWTK